jgi:hypothetical protein
MKVEAWWNEALFKANGSRLLYTRDHKKIKRTSLFKDSKPVQLEKTWHK